MHRDGRCGCVCEQCVSVSLHHSLEAIGTRVLELVRVVRALLEHTHEGTLAVHAVGEKWGVVGEYSISEMGVLSVYIAVVRCGCEQCVSISLHHSLEAIGTRVLDLVRVVRAPS